MPEKEHLQRQPIEQTSNLQQSATRGDSPDIGVEIAGSAKLVQKIRNMMAASRALNRQAEHISSAEKFRTMVHAATEKYGSSEKHGADKTPVVVGRPTGQTGNSAIRSRINVAQQYTNKVPTGHAAKTTQETIAEPSKKDRYADLEKYIDNGLVAQEFVTKEHMHAISNYCKKHNVIIAIRETGSLSLSRIQQGAKPKPHSILEKSIKAGTLKKYYGDVYKNTTSTNKNQGEKMPEIEHINLNDIQGFVGHWGKDENGEGTGQLLGLRVDKRDVVADGSKEPSDVDIIQPFLSGKDSEEPYIELRNFYRYKDALGENWQKFLYTGDYDIHEIYKHNRALVEGSREKARLLTGINTKIASEQTDANNLRTGSIQVHEHTVAATYGEKTKDGKTKKAKLPANTLHAGKDAAYAMIQHGDQMGYITNQISEGRINAISNKAKLIDIVANEDSGRLAWCIKGVWYVTNDPNKADPNNPDKLLRNPLRERKELRNIVGVTASSGWLSESQDYMRSGKSRTLEVKKTVDYSEAEEPSETKEPSETNKYTRKSKEGDSWVIDWRRKTPKWIQE